MRCFHASMRDGSTMRAGRHVAVPAEIGSLFGDLARVSVPDAAADRVLLLIERTLLRRGDVAVIEG
jgi:hypothetical protein